MCLCQARIRLESEGLKRFCYGSTLNVYPSGRSRDTGVGLEAYPVKMGKKAEKSALVGISDAGPEVYPGHGRQAEGVL
jgi:hypothetical protein